MLTAEEIAEADGLKERDLLFELHVTLTIQKLGLNAAERAEDRSEFASRCGYHTAPTVH